MIVTVSGVDPQDAKLVGATVRVIIVGLLDLPTSCMFVMLGLHVNESLALPMPAVLENVMVRGLTAHVALGTLVEARPTVM